MNNPQESSWWRKSKYLVAGIVLLGVSAGLVLVRNEPYMTVSFGILALTSVFIKEALMTFAREKGMARDTKEIFENWAAILSLYGVVFGLPASISAVLALGAST